jgi:hypothetical protein
MKTECIFWRFAFGAEGVKRNFERNIELAGDIVKDDCSPQSFILCAAELGIASYMDCNGSLNSFHVIMKKPSNDRCGSKKALLAGRHARG